jgi:hypothetical protein
LYAESLKMTNVVPVVSKLFDFLRPKEWMKSSTSMFWDIMPCSPLKDNRRFGGTCHLHMVSCLTYSSTPKMEAPFVSETSVGFKRTTGRYIAEERTLHKHHCENLTSYKRNESWPIYRFLEWHWISVRICSLLYRSSLVESW